MCGFGSLGGVGIQLGALSALAPTRRKDFALLVLRALIAGNIACFVTAGIAGILYLSVLESLSFFYDLVTVRRCDGRFWGLREVKVVKLLLGWVTACEQLNRLGV